MIVEFALTTEENEEPLVMEKVLELTKHNTQVGFKIDNVVVQDDSRDEMDRRNKFEALLSSMLAKGAATAARVTLMIK